MCWNPKSARDQPRERESIFCQLFPRRDPVTTKRVASEKRGGGLFVTAKDLVENFDCDCDEAPAPFAHGLVFATRPHGIVWNEKGDVVIR